MQQDANILSNVKFSDFPEKVDKRHNVKIYGDVSCQNYLAVLSHFLHNNEKISDNNRQLIIDSIRSYLHNRNTDNKFEEKNDDAILQLAESPAQYELFSDFFQVPFPAPNKPKFTFIDLFAGIGGFRIAMQNLGGKCVYSSEFDAKAQETYFANYGEMPFGDITKESTKKYIPSDFDLLCAGFPCQAFSLAGKRLGFQDQTRGTLFFEIEEILRKHQPKAFFLENVKGLVCHDKGKTLCTILSHLENAGYDVVKPQILNAMDYGVPQHRERIYIIGFRKDLNADISKFKYPEPITTGVDRPKFRDIMEKNEVSVKYYLSTTYLNTLIKHKQRHEAAGHGFGYKIIDVDGVSNAIVVGGMGRESNLVEDRRLTDFTPVTRIKGEVNHNYIRTMTPREWARLQGFPDNFNIVVSDAAAYKQFGNSVAIPAIQATAKKELEFIGLI
ncbi:MAG: DNA cytosine methyltransferase [Paludibacteraceae bacterium]|nr:DNA cytosine methyltransferase [Paludibacteraceae bacterium]